MKRRAYILVFVLGITTVVTALGLSYIAANGTVMTQATNRYAAVRAQYVAESGVVLAGHFLQYPPTTVAAGGVYPGATGLAIDETFDTVGVTVTTSSPANRYLMRATSTVRNSTGTSSLATQRVQAEVIVPPLPKWTLTQALLCRDAVTVPAGVSIKGNLHSNTSVNGPLLGGSCTGAVTACGTALWLASGPPTSVLSLQPSVTLPSASTSLYSAYSIRGKSYSAYTGYSKNSMSSSDAASLQSIVNAASATNPGSVVILPSGAFKLSDSVTFNGLLVVRGDLEIDGSGNALTAKTDFPALVVTGSIKHTRSAASLTVTGPVVCGGEISDNGHSAAHMTFTGAVVAVAGVSKTAANGSLTITYSRAGATFWDLSRTNPPTPMTLLKWQEN